MASKKGVSLVALFERMCLVRAFELRVAKLYREGTIPGFVHTSVGQEAVAVGVCAALQPTDRIATTHRGHGHCLAKGTDPSAAMAELLGKATGICKGKGGSMHIADARLGILGANAIVGASLALAAGAALSSSVLGGDEVAIAFFGEGAANQGVFHESLNLAAIWSLPVLFVCENNRYSEFSDSRSMSRRRDVAAAAETAGVEAAVVDGNDVEAVLTAASAAVDDCRSGRGPRLLEATTYRWHGHYEGDLRGYKDEVEAAAWRARDPLTTARRRISETGALDDAELDSIEERAERLVDEAERYARESPYPSLDEVWSDVYVN